MTPPFPHSCSHMPRSLKHTSQNLRLPLFDPSKTTSPARVVTRIWNIHQNANCHPRMAEWTVGRLAGPCSWNPSKSHVESGVWSGTPPQSHAEGIRLVRLVRHAFRGRFDRRISTCVARFVGGASAFRDLLYLPRFARS